MTSTRTLIGRDVELEGLQRTLGLPGALVSLVGPPGVGKTALARAAVAGREALWCDCEEVADPSALARVVAEALGLPLGEEGAASLGWALAARGDTVLVLDGIDGLAEELHPVLLAWRRQAPSLGLLLSSRRRPALAAGELVELEGLSLDAAAVLLRRRAGTRAAAQLEDAASLDELLSRLDGLPLAIELAAARLRLLSVEALASRPGLELLADGRRSLSGAIAASWQPLDAELRRALQAAAALWSPFSLADLGAVLGHEEGQILALAEGLLDRSLLTWSPGPEGPRLGLLRSVRDFVLERAPPPAALRERARSLLLRAAEAARADLEGAEAPAALARLQQLRPALEAHLRAAGPTDSLGALRALGALAELVGPLAPMLPRLRTARSLASAAPLRAELLVAEARVLRGLRRHAEAGELLAEAPALLDQLDPLEAEAHRSWRAELWCALGTNQVDRYRLEAGAQSLRQAVADFAHLGDAAGEARARRRLASAELFAGAHDAAAEELARALALARQAGQPRLEALVLTSMGLLERHRRSPTLSEAFFRQALALHQRTGDQRLAATMTGFVGMSLWDQGRLAEASAVLREAVARCGHVGDRAGQATARATLGAVELEVASRDAPAGAEEVAEALERAATEPWPGPRERALLTAGAGMAHQLCGRPADAIVRYRQALPTLEAAGAWDVAWGARAAWALACEDRSTGLAVLEDGQDTRPGTAEQALLEALARQVLVEGFVSAELRQQVQECARGQLRILLHLAEAGHGLAEVALDGSWFRTPSTGRVDLRRKRVLRRLLAVFAAEHAREQPTPLTLSALFEAAWQGERASAESADARVYVAISTLRKLGLRELLLTHTLAEGTGYGLHPSVRLAQPSP